MSKSAKNIMIRVIKRRMVAGETFDAIIIDYQKLTEDDIAELREAVGE